MVQPNHENCFRCRKCGMWVEKGKAVFYFINYCGKEISCTNPRCPECHNPLSARALKVPNGKSGKDKLQAEILLLKNKKIPLLVD